MLSVRPQVRDDVAVEDAAFDQSCVAVVYDSNVFHAAHEYTDAMFDIVESGVSPVATRDGKEGFMNSVSVRDLANC